VDWVISFIQHHYEQITSSKEFLSLTADELLLLIASKNINVKQEEIVSISTSLYTQ